MKKRVPPLSVHLLMSMRIKTRNRGWWNIVLFLFHPLFTKILHVFIYSRRPIVTQEDLLIDPDILDTSHGQRIAGWIKLRSQFPVKRGQLFDLQAARTVSCLELVFFGTILRCTIFLISESPTT